MNTEVDIAKLEQRTLSMETSLTELKADVKILMNRLPLWATWTMTIMGSVIGGLIGVCFR